MLRAYGRWFHLCLTWVCRVKNAPTSLGETQATYPETVPPLHLSWDRGLGPEQLLTLGPGPVGCTLGPAHSQGCRSGLLLSVFLFQIVHPSDRPWLRLEREKLLTESSLLGRWETLGARQLVRKQTQASSPGGAGGGVAARH